MCPSFGQNMEVILYHLTLLLEQEWEGEGERTNSVWFGSLSGGTELGNAIPEQDTMHCNTQHDPDWHLRTVLDTTNRNPGKFKSSVLKSK